MKINIIFSLVYLLLSWNISISQNQIQLLDIYGKIINLEQKTLKKSTILLFYSDYNCINCINVLKGSLVRLGDSLNIKVLIISRLPTKFDELDAVHTYNRIKKRFDSDEIYFDIHQSIDTWPPTNIEDGLFGKYKLNKFPAVLVIYNTKEILLTYDELFPDNYTIVTLYKKILQSIKKISY